MKSILACFLLLIAVGQLAQAQGDSFNFTTNVHNIHGKNYGVLDVGPVPLNTLVRFPESSETSDYFISFTSYEHYASFTFSKTDVDQNSTHGDHFLPFHFVFTARMGTTGNIIYEIAPHGVVQPSHTGNKQGEQQTAGSQTVVMNTQLSYNRLYSNIDGHDIKFITKAGRRSLDIDLTGSTLSQGGHHNPPHGDEPINDPFNDPDFWNP